MALQLNLSSHAYSLEDLPHELLPIIFQDNDSNTAIALRKVSRTIYVIASETFLKSARLSDLNCQRRILQCWVLDSSLLKAQIKIISLAEAIKNPNFSIYDRFCCLHVWATITNVELVFEKKLLDQTIYQLRPIDETDNNLGVQVLQKLITFAPWFIQNDIPRILNVVIDNILFIEKKGFLQKDLKEVLENWKMFVSHLKPEQITPEALDVINKIDKIERFSWRLFATLKAVVPLVTMLPPKETSRMIEVIISDIKACWCDYLTDCLIPLKYLSKRQNDSISEALIVYVKEAPHIAKEMSSILAHFLTPEQNADLLDAIGHKELVGHLNLLCEKMEIAPLLIDVPIMSVFEPIMSKLHDQKKSVRKAARKALRLLASKKPEVISTISPLILRQLNNESLKNRINALKTLRSVASSLTENQITPFLIPVINCLEDENRDAVLAALTTLLKFASKLTIEQSNMVIDKVIPLLSIKYGGRIQDANMGIVAALAPKIASEKITTVLTGLTRLFDTINIALATEALAPRLKQNDIFQFKELIIRQLKKAYTPSQALMEVLINNIRAGLLTFDEIVTLLIHIDNRQAFLDNFASSSLTEEKIEVLKYITARLLEKYPHDRGQGEYYLEALTKISDSLTTDQAMPIIETIITKLSDEVHMFRWDSLNIFCAIALKVPQNLIPVILTSVDKILRVRKYLSRHHNLSALKLWTALAPMLTSEQISSILNKKIMMISPCISLLLAFAPKMAPYDLPRVLQIVKEMNMELAEDLLGYLIATGKCSLEQLKMAGFRDTCSIQLVHQFSNWHTQLTLPMKT